MMDDTIEIAGQRFVAAAALADVLRIHKRTILTWAEDHGMPVIKVGQHEAVRFGRCCGVAAQP